MWGSSPSQHLNLMVVLTLLFIWISALNFIISFFDPIWQSAGSDCWGLCRPSSSPFPELAWNAAAIKAAVCLPTSTTKKHEEQPARRPATIKKEKEKKDHLHLRRPLLCCWLSASWYYPWCIFLMAVQSLGLIWNSRGRGESELVVVVGGAPSAARGDWRGSC